MMKIIFCIAMNAIRTTYFKTVFGELILGEYNAQLCLCDWRYRKMRTAIDQRLKTLLQADFVEEETDTVALAMQQLNEYFKGERTVFDIPMMLAGSEFQQKVWQALLKIPFGKTDTYLGLSNKLQNPKAIRAVAAANGANAISIIVPCHRIIGSNGELVGYAGGLKAKQQLLNLEREGSGQMELFE
jgi:methylated-DNA-[protein]-cysteine S-methyltransferase